MTKNLRNLLIRPQASKKDAQATGEAFSPQKRTFNTSKHEISSLFYLCGSFCPPGSIPDSATHINAYSDPQPCKQLCFSFKLFSKLYIETTCLYCRTIEIQGERVKLQIWDTAGQFSIQLQFLCTGSFFLDLLHFCQPSPKSFGSGVGHVLESNP